MTPREIESVTIAMNGTISGIAGVELSGIKLECASRDLLDVSRLDFDQHVAMHPSAIAYYGQLLRDAKLMLEIAEREFEKEKSKWFVEARVVVESVVKVKTQIRAEDIKGQAYIRHGKEYEQWEQRIDRLKSMVNTLESWYKAWEQKSYAMSMYAKMDDGEGNTSPHKLTKATSVRGIIDSVRRERTVTATVTR